MFARSVVSSNSRVERPLTSMLPPTGDKGLVSNILEEDVVQPLLVSTSAIELAAETVALLLRVDDYHLTR